MFTKIKYILVAVSAIILSFANPYTAMASSIYDDTYRTTSALTLQASNYYGTTCSPIDVSSNWMQYLTDRSKYYGSDTEFNEANMSWQKALAYGQWGVSQRISKMNNGDPSRYATYFTIFWNESPTNSLVWDMSYAYPNKYGVKAASGTHMVTVQVYSGNCDWRGGGYSTSSNTYISDNIDANDPYYL